VTTHLQLNAHIRGWYGLRLEGSLVVTLLLDIFIINLNFNNY